MFGGVEKNKIKRFSLDGWKKNGVLNRLFTLVNILLNARELDWKIVADDLVTFFSSFLLPTTQVVDKAILARGLACWLTSLWWQWLPTLHGPGAGPVAGLLLSTCSADKRWHAWRVWRDTAKRAAPAVGSSPTDGLASPTGGAFVI
jgi:hypothetical protein